MISEGLFDFLDNKVGKGQGRGWASSGDQRSLRHDGPVDRCRTHPRDPIPPGERLPRLSGLRLAAIPG